MTYTHFNIHTHESFGDKEIRDMLTSIEKTVGFAFALFALPMMLFLRPSLPESSPLCVIGSTVQRIPAIIYLRRAIQWRELTGILIAIVLLLLMRKLHSLTPDRVKQAVGVCIIATLLVRWFVKVEPREAVAKAWGYLGPDTEFRVACGGPGIAGGHSCGVDCETVA